MDLADFALYYSPAPTESKTYILFAHANGIPAQTYTSLLKKMSCECNAHIFSYDMRGIGKTNLKEQHRGKEWAWQILIEDHIFLFSELQRKHPGRWILAGHSLGSWLSLLSCEKLGIKELWLFDPPILHPRLTLYWSFAVLMGKRHMSPNSKKVRRRKTTYPSYEAAYESLKKNVFMQGWSKEVLYDYLEGTFAQKEGCIELRHSPNWEADIFEEYFPAAFLGFLKVPFRWRMQIKPLFFVGEKSDTCNPQAKPWVQLFFPKLKWEIVKGGGHMFPLELQEETVSLAKQAKKCGA